MTWIKLHRKLLENPVFQRSAYLALWVYCLLRANHKPNDLMWDGGVLHLETGQFATSRPAICKDTDIKGTTIEDILNFFVKQKMIRQDKYNRFRVITITNWKKYQGICEIPTGITTGKMVEKTEKSDRQSDNRATTERQQADTDKNVENVKKRMFYKKTGEQIVESPRGSGKLVIWRNNEPFEFADKKSEIEYRK